MDVDFCQQQLYTKTYFVIFEISFKHFQTNFLKNSLTNIDLQCIQTSITLGDFVLYKILSHSTVIWLGFLVSISMKNVSLKQRLIKLNFSEILMLGEKPKTPPKIGLFGFY